MSLPFSLTHAHAHLAHACVLAHFCLLFSHESVVPVRNQAINSTSTVIPSRLLTPRLSTNARCGSVHLRAFVLARANGDVSGVAVCVSILCECEPLLVAIQDIIETFLCIIDRSSAPNMLNAMDLNMTPNKANANTNRASSRTYTVTIEHR